MNVKALIPTPMKFVTTAIIVVAVMMIVNRMVAKNPTGKVAKAIHG